MELLQGVVRDYDWGSPTAIPELLGVPPSGEPMAELWLGAHPSAPALVGSSATPLDRMVADDPAATIGPEVANRFGRLPFLLKVLAAAHPLSLQAHPSTAQAEAGFAREEAAGTPRDAPERSFRDRWHKPELICALEEFDALCGFRDPVATLELLRSIGSPGLGSVIHLLAEAPGPEGLGRVLSHLLTLDRSQAALLVESVVTACRRQPDGPHAEERRMAARLDDQHPGDPGVVIALLLNRVRLQPGEALFLGSGNLHMYLRGTGVEVMASSDNVLRGGLTTKHVDVPTLLEVVDPSPIVPVVQRPIPSDGVARYDCPVPEFSLERIDLDGRATLAPGPAIVLCTQGRADGGAHVLERGAAAWIPAADGPIELDGRATIFRAGVGRPDAAP